ncbi:MAG: ribonuclease H family protein [Acidimicrobiales bacterium]
MPSRGDSAGPTTVYTDGACRGNPGPGGWAWAVPGGRFRSGAEAQTTNQRMELKAALDAVSMLDGPLEVVSDSTYVVNCFRDRWWEGWVRRGWLNAQKKVVANQDLWRPLVDAYLVEPGRIRFRWVKGHANDPYNDLVDRLAVEAAATQRGRSGEGAPPLEPPLARSDPRSNPAPGSVPGVPAGYGVAVSGLRPVELGGYAENAVAAATRERLAAILAGQGQLHPDLQVLTGLGLGAESLGAEAAAQVGIPFVAVLAYPEPDAPWPAEARRRFAHLAEKAAAVITLQGRRPDSKQAAGAALARRDAWLARHAAEAIVVWDGEDRAVGRLVRSFQDHLGEEQVWVLEPAVTP